MKIINKICFLGVAFLGGLGFTSFSQAELSKESTFSKIEGFPSRVIDSDIVIGSPEAPVSLIKYTSLTCAICAEFYKNHLPMIVEEFIKPGKVKLIIREFPYNKVDLSAGAILHCAENPLEVMLEIFFNQSSWISEKDPLKALKGIFAKKGFSEERMKKCLSDKAVIERIVNGRLEAQEKFEIEAVPSFVFHDQAVVPGLVSVENMKKIINMAIEHQAQGKPSKEFSINTDALED